MANIQKPLSDRDANQTLQSAFNPVDATFSTNGFLVGKVGNRIVRTVVSNTEQYDFYSGSDLLYSYLLTYTAVDLQTLQSAERIA